ncbi:MAG: enoyl-CoA hydratase/isomerase family protein [Pseudomonadales bacterium]|nr:enoyl-CoA hydratase/isomerase family protein [Pseudomonadales bacterium]
MEPVLFETRDTRSGHRVGVATLNSEKTLNSLSLPMIDLLTAKLHAWREDESVVAILIQGAGERAFSAGGDIQDLYKSMREHPGGPNPYADAFFEREYRLDFLLHTYPKPVIAWATGFVMGGGLGVMAACSHRIGTEQSRIAMPEITIGLFPDAGATWFLARMPAHLSHFIAWTGCQLTARDGQRVGLIDHVVRAGDKQALFDALINANWTLDAAMNGELIDEAAHRMAASAEALPPEALAGHENTILALVTESLRHKRPATRFGELVSGVEPEDDWLSRAFATFRAGCPVTAHVVHEQITRAQGLSLGKTFELELAIAIQCSRHPDFVEGIRARLIDRDNTPAWRHASLAEVPEDYVNEHFVLPVAGGNPLRDLAAKEAT